MAGQKARVIPGISLSALDGIADPNVRDVLRAIVDGLNVRNGAAGTGDERFVTAKELGLTGGRTVIGGGMGNYGNNLSTPENTTFTAAQIKRIINDLQAEIMESPLFKKLGERVNLIDTPGGLFSKVANVETAIKNEVTARTTADTAIVQSVSGMGARVGQAEAAILEQKEFRTNSDNALAQAINTIWAAVGNNTGLVQTGTEIVANTAGAVANNWNQVQAAVKDAGGNIISSAIVRQETQTVADKAGKLEAQWTVKTDVNGYVSGFGLASTVRNAIPASEFIVRADRFAIASPAGPGITPVVPFIVTTTPKQLADGTILQPGVYMDFAMVKELYGAYIEAGNFKAANIYTGSTLVDFYSKLPISSVAAGSWVSNGAQNIGTSVVTDPGLRFYGSTRHWQTDRYHRCRVTPDNNSLLTFSISISAVVDHYLSIWYRYSGGSWVHLAKVIEPQPGYGSASVMRVVNLGLSFDEFIEFGFSVTDETSTIHDAAKDQVQSWSMNVSCVNL